MPKRKPTKKQKAKVAKVMSEYGSGKLKSSSGRKITSQRQAIAVALSEANLARKKKK